MKIELDYDELSGVISDPLTNNALSTWAGLESCEVSTATPAVDLLGLKASGFTVDEIIKLKDAGLLP